MKEDKNKKSDAAPASPSPTSDYAIEDYMDELIQSKKLEAGPSMAQKRGQDERAMIREQERHAQERRTKKRRRRRNIIITVIVLLLAAGIWFIGWGYSLIFSAGTDTGTVTIEVSDGQEVIYAQLTSVKGNEITYTIAEAVDTAEEDPETEGELPEGATEGESPEKFSEGELPEGATEGESPEKFSEGELPKGTTDGELPEEFSEGEMPEGAADDMEAPEETGEGTEEAGDGQSSSAAASSATVLTAKASSLTVTSATVTGTDSYSVTSLGMGGMSGGGDMGGGDRGGFGGGGSFDFDSFDFSSFGDSSSAVTSSASDTFTYDGVTYRLTEESATMQIPVGTDVTTRLGSVTTFASLSAGDCVALVVQEVEEEQVIMAVYIIG
ncbi:MAG: hypothetical protein LUH58_05950 [Lachnospiraceae bacterium]|nr:hypothetical protein [Lachnospiraceae bacterium]